MPSRDRLGFMASLGFAQWEPERILRVLSKIGYRGVGWRLSHFNPRTKSPEELARLVELTGEHGMCVAEIVVQQDYVSLDEGERRDRIELTKECIQAAGENKLNVVNVFTGPAPWDPKAPRIPEDISEGEAWAQVLDAYDQILLRGE
ncbi:MAG: sugar phosphate isomerase/epimerase family protein [bacterium]